MVVAFYCLAALDILGVLDTSAKEDEQAEWRKWIWKQQIVTRAGSAFRAGPAMALPEADYIYDPPHLIMTFAAILSLAILRDDFSQLDRIGLRKFLGQMQQTDGSFATHPGSMEHDLRATYCAFVICHLLDAWDSIDVPRALSFIESCRSYEGGFGQTPHLESHGGPTFCAVACLSLCPESYIAENSTSQKLISTKNARTAHWLAQRQIGGFQGRTNKDEDACYCFWCGAALKVLGADAFVNVQANAAFLDACQFRFGGIAKSPGENPDPFHTYMSLAVLSIYTPAAGEGEEPLELRSLDVALNATIATAEWARKYMSGTGKCSC